MIVPCQMRKSSGGINCLNVTVMELLLLETEVIYWTPSSPPHQLRQKVKGKQTDTKCTFVIVDKSETLLERCLCCVYPRGLGVWIKICGSNKL